MSITIELPSPTLEDLREVTSEKSDAAAVIEAVSEFVRMKRLQELKDASGKIEFVEMWRECEEVELEDRS